MKSVYRALLRLYPRDYRAKFGYEIARALERRAHESRANLMKECAGLMGGAASEWIAKLTTDKTIRGRVLPDLVMMRPPGVPKEVHFSGPILDDERCWLDT